MKCRAILVLVAGLSAWGQGFAQGAVEAQVLRKVQAAYQAGGVTFSGLYNSDQFSAEERAFLGRLYEILFSLPGHVQQETAATGKIPTRQEIGASFGVSPASVTLLLAVMEQDSRIPPLFTRDASGEITGLNDANITAFSARRGDSVRLTQWEGQPLPEFRLTSFDGKTVTRDSLKGKPVLLYFWFTGCPPCVRSAPLLEELHGQFGDRVQFIGINADQVLDIGTTPESRRNYAAQQGLRFTQLELDAAVRTLFGSINIYPTYFLADAEGTVRRHLLNFQPKETLGSALQEAVGGR